MVVVVAVVLGYALLGVVEGYGQVALRTSTSKPSQATFRRFNLGEVEKFGEECVALAHVASLRKITLSGVWRCRAFVRALHLPMHHASHEPHNRDLQHNTSMHLMIRRDRSPHRSPERGKERTPVEHDPRAQRNTTATVLYHNSKSQFPAPIR